MKCKASPGAGALHAQGLTWISRDREGYDNTITERNACAPINTRLPNRYLCYGNLQQCVQYQCFVRNKTAQIVQIDFDITAVLLNTTSHIYLVT